MRVILQKCVRGLRKWGKVPLEIVQKPNGHPGCVVPWRLSVESCWGEIVGLRLITSAGRK